MIVVSLLLAPAVTAAAALIERRLAPSAGGWVQRPAWPPSRSGLLACLAAAVVTWRGVPIARRPALAR